MSNERDDLLNAGISPRERLANIEGLLRVMDGKLDGKADVAYVAALEQRVRLIEIGGDARSNEMRGRVDKQDDQLGAIQRKLAYATGTLATVVVISNATLAWFITH
jgi:predicted RNA-binding protein